jgi:hypothetical protein
LYTLTSLTLSSVAQVWSCNCKNGRWIFWDESRSLYLAISSLRYAPYLLVSLGGILGDILDGILIFLVVFLISATTIVAVEYCPCFVLWDILSGAIYLEKDALTWLSVGSSAASRIILSSKGYGARGWLRAYGWVTIL